LSQPATIAETKRRLRGEARRIRAGAHESGSQIAGVTLARHGLALLGESKPGTVSGYHPFDTEIDCLPLLAALESAGWRVALPVVVARGEPLLFRQWTVGAPLRKGMWDILVPGDSAEIVVPDVLLAPLLAFDRSGFRLGYGGGFYDRSLQQLRAAGTATAVGVAYAVQEMERCPREAFDQPLDAVLTENGPMRPYRAGPRE